MKVHKATIGSRLAIYAVTRSKYPDWVLSAALKFTLSNRTAS